MKILGIWDGHDSGAAIIENNKILFAINEERLTRRKLEITFPEKAIKSCLEYVGVSATSIHEVAFSTSDFAKTLTRIFPSLKEEYYMLRRRLKGPEKSSVIKKKLKYKLTEYAPTIISNKISYYVIKKRLKKIGFQSFNLHLLDHHQCHSASAAFCSGFSKSLVLTLDGLGDGLSGSVYTFDSGKMTCVATFPARHSLGVFFEHITNLMNMRELEDEGKVMALANYAYPVEDEKNPMLELIHIDGLSIRCRYSSLKMYKELEKILWKYPSEQFAYMAQKTLETMVLKLVHNALFKTNMDNICLAGGIFSNVKVNRLIRTLPETKKCFVFPHMGDGGLSIGAAIEANHRLNGIHDVPLTDLYLGQDYSEEGIEYILKKYQLSYKKSKNISAQVANIIADGGIVFWFQGRMEIGPRALGARSILARADSDDIKDTLNLQLKKRVWYQPFCPSILEEDAKKLVEDYEGIPDDFMTMAYMVKTDSRECMRGVINVDGSCRPQIVCKDSSFRNLLMEIKKITGLGVVLNTSYNIHGEPVVCSPEDAIKTFLKTQNRYLAIHDFLITQ